MDITKVSSRKRRYYVNKQLDFFLKKILKIKLIS